MEKIITALSGVFYLATSENDQPHVRPFDNACIYNNELYIGTNNNKLVFSQLKNNPQIEIFGLEHGTIRFTATATVIEDEEINKIIYDLLNKDYNDTCIAVKLNNIKGTLTTTMGQKIDLNF